MTGRERCSATLFAATLFVRSGEEGDVVPRGIIRSEVRREKEVRGIVGEVVHV